MISILYCRKSRLFLTGLLLFTGTMIYGQIIATAKISVDSVQIGDPVSIDIRIKIPSDIVIKGLDFAPFLRLENQLFLSDTNFMDKFADLEILDFGMWKQADINQPLDVSKLNISIQNGQQVIENTIKISIYNMGVFDIIPPDVIVEGKPEIMPTELQKLVVTIPETVMKQDSVTLNPIKDIMREDADMSDYMVYVYTLIALLLMILVGYYFYKRKRKRHDVEVEEVTEILLPHEKALRSLSVLDSKRLWQQGQVKEYQSELTGIIRQYLEDRYQIRAPEMTTDEITNALSRPDFDRNYILEVKEILQIADLVKFAKAIPGEDVHAGFMLKAVAFVEHTKVEDQ
ncbi:MAG: hypothetical protein H7X99_04700 [Saprospiraceae bacterium]|nr:hypothetical protein [Saprospiraceae bacterium]